MVMINCNQRGGPGRKDDGRMGEWAKRSFAWIIRLGHSAWQYSEWSYRILLELGNR